MVLECCPSHCHLTDSCRLRNFDASFNLEICQLTRELAMLKFVNIGWMSHCACAYLF